MGDKVTVIPNNNILIITDNIMTPKSDKTIVDSKFFMRFNFLGE